MTNHLENIDRAPLTRRDFVKSSAVLTAGSLAAGQLAVARSAHRGGSDTIRGGLIGCASAYYLSRCDWDVTLVERESLGAGASHGNCGYICPSHAMPLSGPGVIARTLPSLLRSDAPLAIA